MDDVKTLLEEGAAADRQALARGDVPKEAYFGRGTAHFGAFLRAGGHPVYAQRHEKRRRNPSRKPLDE